LSKSLALIVLLIGFACCAQSMREAADRAGVLIGTAVRPSQLNEDVYAATLAHEFNMIEPEDAMKWHVLRPDKATFDFASGDSVVRFAQTHSMKVRGHCLAWGRDNPGWLVHGQFTSRQLSRLLHEHISRVLKHYAGEVFAWDVVNEALDENGELRDSIWRNQPGIGLSEKGTGYIANAFRWAHAADPRALLFYNEAEAEGMSRKSDAVYAMVKDFKRRGVPIDGVGLQMHIPSLDSDIAAMSAGISANIARLAQIGVQVHITELDVSVPVDSLGRARAEDLIRQAAIYRSVVRACLDNANCTAIQTWGFTDKYSWIGSHSHHTRGDALLFDRNYSPKPSYQAVFEELNGGRDRGGRD
jgi:endo-1,4-beta-xylanase